LAVSLPDALHRDGADGIRPGRPFVAFSNKKTPDA